MPGTDGSCLSGWWWPTWHVASGWQVPVSPLFVLHTVFGSIGDRAFEAKHQLLSVLIMPHCPVAPQTSQVAPSLGQFCTQFEGDVPHMLAVAAVNHAVNKTHNAPRVQAVLEADMTQGTWLTL